MALTKKTWLWIVAAVLGLGVIGIIAIAGMGVYFVSKHINTAPSTAGEATRAFEAIRTQYKDQPLLELDNSEHVRLRRPVADLPAGKTRPEHMWLLVWDPADERLVKMSVPFWVMRLGRKKIDFFNQEQTLDLERLKLTVQDLERIGPMLLLDHKVPTGQRVLIWTQ